MKREVAAALLRSARAELSGRPTGRGDTVAWTRSGYVVVARRYVTPKGDARLVLEVECAAKPRSLPTADGAGYRLGPATLDPSRIRTVRLTRAGRLRRMLAGTDTSFESQVTVRTRMRSDDVERVLAAREVRDAARALLDLGFREVELYPPDTPPVTCWLARVVSRVPIELDTIDQGASHLGTLGAHLPWDGPTTPWP